MSFSCSLDNIFGYQRWTIGSKCVVYQYSYPQRMSFSCSQDDIFGYQRWTEGNQCVLYQCSYPQMMSFSCSQRPCDHLIHFQKNNTHSEKIKDPDNNGLSRTLQSTQPNVDQKCFLLHNIMA